MSRYSAPHKIHAEHWDQDEWAWVKTKLSFPAAQRVVFHTEHIQLSNQATEEAIEESAQHMAAALMELLDSWTLRKPETPYEEVADRPKWDLTLENILLQPLDDVLFMFQEGMNVFRNAKQPKEQDLITETARADGLNAENFPAGDAAGGDIPGGSTKA